MMNLLNQQRSTPWKGFPKDVLQTLVLGDRKQGQPKWDHCDLEVINRPEKHYI